MITARALAASQQTSFRPPFEVLDWSSLASATRVAAGLPGFDSSKVRSDIEMLDFGDPEAVVPLDSTAVSSLIRIKSIMTVW
jgi:hypothetical protein